MENSLKEPQEKREKNIYICKVPKNLFLPQSFKSSMQSFETSNKYMFNLNIGANLFTRIQAYSKIAPFTNLHYYSFL